MDRSKQVERKGKTKGKSGSYSLSEGEFDEVQRLLNLGIGHGIHLYMLSGMSGCKDIGENYFFNDQIKCFFQASSSVTPSVVAMRLVEEEHFKFSYVIKLTQLAIATRPATRMVVANFRSCCF